MLTAGPISASALSERLDMVRYVYWTETMSADARKALLVTWLKALASIPAIFVRASFDEWFTTGTRRPTPGDIGNRAREMQAHAQVRRDNLAGQSADVVPMRPPTDEEIEARREHNQEVAAKLAKDFPDMLNPDGTPRRVRPKRMGTSEADL